MMSEKKLLNDESLEMNVTISQKNSLASMQCWKLPYAIQRGRGNGNEQKI